MNKKILLYAITTFFIFSVVNVFSSEINIPVWLSNFDILYNGEKIEFTDAQGKSCDSFIYNGITYVPLRSMAETMGKQVYWNGEDKRVSIEDELIIDEVIIKRNGYTVTAELHNEADEKHIKTVEKSSESLKIGSANTYEIELDYFEPVPDIEVKVNKGYSARVDYGWDPEHLNYCMMVFNTSNSKITEYKINFKRRYFGEYIKNSTVNDIPLEKIYKINSYWQFEDENKKNVKVECYNIGDSSWATFAYACKDYDIANKIVYDSPLITNAENVFRVGRTYPTYKVYAVKSGIEEELFFETKGDFGGYTEYTLLDGTRTEHTIIIDYFEPIPYLEGSNVVQQPSYQNPVAKIERVSIDGKSVIIHTIKFQRRKFSDSLASRNIDIKFVKDADEIYTNSNCFWSYGKILTCIKDENEIWNAYTTMFGKNYPIESPDI